MWVAGGADLPCPMRTSQRSASLSVPMHTSAATGKARPPSPVTRPRSWRSHLRGRAVRCSQRSAPGKEQTGRTGLRDVARRTRRAGVRAPARRRRRWRRSRSSTGVSNNSNASALPCSGVVASPPSRSSLCAHLELVTMRLIQDSTIDLVRPILSCNDQTSIKIAE